MAGKQARRMASLDTDLESNDDLDESQDAQVRDDGDENAEGAEGSEATAAEGDAQGDVEVVEGDQDRRLTEEGDEGDGDAHGEGGKGDAAQQERHRETARERRQRAKAAKERDKRELDMQLALIRRQDAEIAEMRKILDAERRQRIDERIAVLTNEVSTFEQIEKAAISKQAGDDAVQARSLRDKAQQQIEALQKERKATETQREAPKADPRMVAVFASRNPWYNKPGAEQDTAVTNALDAQVAAEGYNPQTPAYWDELERRIYAALPQRKPQEQRSNDNDNDESDPQPRQQTRRGPPVGGSRGNGKPPQRIVLSPARVQALKEAGLWDDPKTRARMAQRYAQYDASNSNDNEEG